MFHSTSDSLVRHDRVTVVLCLFVMLACWPSSAAAANSSWTGGDGNWSNPVRWQPLGVPSPADIAFIGNAGVPETAVALDQNDTISGLVITNQMRLNTDGNTLFVSGATTIDGGAGFFTNDSRLNILQGSIVTTQNLALSDGGSVFLDDGRYDITGTATIGIDSKIFGDHGSTIRLFGASSPSLINNGELLGRFDGGLVIDQVSTGRIDLDGNSGNGKVLVDRSNLPGTLHSTLTINGDTLHDDFNGVMRIAQEGTANMNLTDGWTMGAGSTLVFAGAQLGINQLNGGEVTLASAVKTQFQSIGHINADAIVTESAEVEAFSESELGFHGETQILGGQFTLSEDAKLEFVDSTTVKGGTFNTHSNLSVEGFVNFRGHTDWDGTATINGIARQNGDARVVGATTIQAGVFDMDGGGGTAWNVNDKLLIHADGMDSTISNSFDGVLNIGGGFAPELTLNLSDPADHWTMAGEMNLSHLNFVPFPVNRVAGSLMRLTGELNVSHLVGISATVTFDNGSETNLLDATDRLTVTGQATVRSGAAFNGVGTLVNSAAEGMTLEDGASLDDVGLLNAGLLEIGDSPGVASVDRFESTEEGTWLVEIGGHVAGSEHDLLLVTDGETLLDGLIEVDLIDAGGGLFLPEIGDEFTVLTSLGAVSGGFTNDPVSLAAGQAFHWEVLHHPNDVTLRLIDITDGVPEPASQAFVCIASFAIALSRGQAALDRTVF